MNTLLTIVKLFKPKYYNVITGTLVTCGTSLLSKPLWLSFINWGIESSNENYVKLYIPLIEEYDWVLGLFIILISLIWNSINRLIDIKEQKESKPAYLESEIKKFEKLPQLCKEIYPILVDNEYLFKTIGPNSGSNSNDDLRIDLTLWYKFREESIVPNNTRIKDILKKNEHLFTREFENNSRLMILHIDAFEEHIKNEAYDYSEFQFPVEFKNNVESICYQTGVTSKTFLRKKKWINRRFKKYHFKEWYFFGSSLLIPEKAKDFDIVIYTEQDLDNERLLIFEELKFDFKVKFKTDIHMTIFTVSENNSYQEFIRFNQLKIKGNG